MYIESDIEYETFDGSRVKSFITGDDSSGKAILVIQEIWGLSNFIRSYSKRLASLGFLVIAPHLYSRDDERDVFTPEVISNSMRLFFDIPQEKRRDPETIKSIMERASQDEKEFIKRVMMDRGNLEKRMLKDLKMGYEYIKGKYEIRKFGVVGFCMGGGLSFQISTEIPFDASVVFYGANPPIIDAVSSINGPVMALYAGEDDNINSGVPDAVRAFFKYKKQLELKLYPNTRHAFFNHDGMAYNKDAAEDAWDRSSAFFRRYL